MAQQILTKSIKDQIITNALEKAGINKRKQQLRAARVAWAERVRIEAIGGYEAEADVKEILNQIEALSSKIPEELKSGYSYVYERDGIKLNLAGCSVTAYFNGNRRAYESKAPEDLYKITPHGATLMADNPLVTEFHCLESRHRKLESDESDVKQNVSAALEKVRTVKSLLTKWPEAKELLEGITLGVPLMPAIRRETLNIMIGLPTEETKKA